MPPAKRTKHNDDDEEFTPTKRARKSTPQTAPKAKKVFEKTEKTPKMASEFSTEATVDELIYPDATFESYAEFEEKFNKWKERHFHPFRVASSETLRTETGAASEKFKYRYVVFHCARYGNPRMRGEGKRPNQNYLPCACTAALRLNFQFNEQCLRLTTLETRHSNHELCPQFYESLMLKEKKKMKLRSVDNSSESSSSPDREELNEKEKGAESEEPKEIVTEFYPAPIAPIVPVPSYEHNLISLQMPLQTQQWPPFQPIAHPIPLRPYPGHHLQPIGNENQPPTSTDIEELKPVVLGDTELEETLADARLMFAGVAAEVRETRLANLSALISYWKTPKL